VDRDYAPLVQQALPKVELPLLVVDVEAPGSDNAPLGELGYAY
jgi:hypothetical protein